MGVVIAKLVVLVRCGTRQLVERVGRRDLAAIIIEERVVEAEGDLAGLALEGGDEPMGVVIFRGGAVVADKIRLVDEGQGLDGVLLTEQRHQVEPQLQRHIADPRGLRREAVARDAQDVVVITFLNAEREIAQPGWLLPVSRSRVGSLTSKRQGEDRPEIVVLQESRRAEYEQDGETGNLHEEVTAQAHERLGGKGLLT